MTAGYSNTPLWKKLGLMDGLHATVINPPEDYLTDLLSGAPDMRWGASDTPDLIHLFTADRAEMARVLTEARGKMRREGMIWVSWPKKASKVPTDVTEDVIREVALPMGLVDVKVCAVDTIWSGLKLVIRKELR